MGSIEFVTFHYPSQPGQESHPNETLLHREYLKSIEMMLRSARLFHLDMRAVVITSSCTRLRGIRYPVIKYVAEISPDKLMLSRTRAQLKYLKDSSFKSPIVFLDSDILINGSLAPIFETDFDIALTCRTLSSVPINGGLVVINNRRPEIAQRFFDSFAKMYEGQFLEQAKWYGDQLAMVELLGLKPFAASYPEVIEVDGCKVLLLPCDTYNFSPENLVESIKEPLQDKIVLHFKGQRKRLMELYWRSFLIAKNSSPWWRRVVRFGGLRRLQQLLDIEREAMEKAC